MKASSVNRPPVMLPDAVRAQIMAIFAEEAEELLAAAERTLDEIVASPAHDHAARWREIQRALHTLKGSCAAAGAAHAEAATHALEDRVACFVSGAEALTQGSAHALFDALSELRRVMAEVSQGATAGAPHAAPTSDEAARAPSRNTVSEASASGSEARSDAPRNARSKASDLLRVRPERIDALDALVGELVLARLQNRALIERIADLRAQSERTMLAYRDLESRLRSQARALGSPALRGVEGASRALGSELLELARETHALSRQAPLVNAQAVAVSTSLEDGIRELRMMPLAPFFDEYAAVVREAARESDKAVRLEVRAEGAEIDRAVLLKLRDPLLHLVRNSVVHGIEPASERTSRGKDAQGTVTLEALCEGSRAVLRIRDDGRGVDVHRVLERARALGLATSAGEDVSAQALLDLLTHPGFSTRDHVDHLAGRGIGMDIVASAVDELGGTLRLDFEPGRGTVFTIEVPITAASSRGLVVRVGEHRLAFLLNRVERVLRLGWDDIRHLEGRPTIQVSDEVLSVVELAKLVDVRGDADALKVPALVLRHGRQRLAVLVDDVPGEQALVLRPFGRAMAGCRLFVGGAVQADGSVLPVLDVDTLFARAGAKEVTLARPALPANDNQPHVLVVDDSITMRTMLRNILSAAGYRVVVAADGEQALLRLNEMPQCDAVVTDMQMPHLDGVGLCRAIRAGSGPHVPIVMVTSVGDAVERQKALDAGADAYVVKAEFEQVGFLERLRGLVGPTLRRAP